MKQKVESAWGGTRKILDMVDHIGLTPADESVSTLIELYDIAVLLPSKEIEEWLAIDTQDSRARFLEDALVKYGYEQDYEPSDAVLTIRRISKIEISTLQLVMREILKEGLPNVEVAAALLESLQDKGRGQGGLVTLEIADLAYKVASKDSNPNSALCMGVSADGFALQVSQNLPVNHSLPALGVGRTTRKRIYSIAGTSITITDKPIFEEPKYDIGFTADSWNMQPQKSIFQGSMRINFPGVSSEVLSLQNMLTRIDGRILCLVPVGWLFKTTAQDLKFKKYLISSGYVEAVIQLPPSILPITSIVSAIIVINTADRKEEIQFIHAGSDNFVETLTRNDRRLSNRDEIVSLLGSRKKTEFSEYASKDAVLENSCNLDVKRYIQPPEADRIEAVFKRYPVQRALGDLVEIVRCQAIKDEGSGGVEVKEISPVNIDQYGMLVSLKEFKLITPSEKDLPRVEKQRVKARDIVFTIKGALGKCALVDQKYEGYIASQSFVILRMVKKTDVSEVELFRFLSSDFGQELISRWASGSTVKMIKMQDLKKLTVPVPTEEQKKVLHESHEEILNLIQQKRSIERKIEKTIKGFWF